MIIKTLKVRILRALKSLPAGADSPPTKPCVASVPHADALSDDASFFDAREAVSPAKQSLLPVNAEGAEPLDAWELVDPQGDKGEEEEEEEPDDTLLLLLESFPLRCPPGGERAVVLYTTTLRGVRRTFEDCAAVRALLECLAVAFQERDVSMDRGLRDQLRALVAGGDGDDDKLVAAAAVVPPRLFVRGRDLGGAAQVLALHEDGRLASLLHLAGADAVDAAERDNSSNSKCEACGGLRFVVCGWCDGSRKVFDDGGRAARCRGCNENGLVMCARCL